MIAKVVILLAVFAAAHAVGVAGPWLGAGHYAGFTAGTAINHVAPAAPLAGAWGYGAGYGHGLVGAAPLAYGHGGLYGLGHGGVLGARYGGVYGLGHGAGLAGKYW